ncbi:tyrosine-type recombinase/integrase [Dethiosulfovibrio salsuginis]|uniref:Integrase n=1 Tax=Dethiosulfovibrio salsuginis TaxID=561720 RepID=A0A1X7JHB3_9BACT|nr:tyrosine-type recombinase/integrase [Dethiosulfovibrio salsuginis]SMG27431.1 Integrase [Dethiosulfovibrio salsuginis]
MNDSSVKKLSAKEKRYMVQDSDGLYLEILPSGTKSWKVRFTVNGTTIRKTLGRYPDISLKEARLRRDEIRIALVHGKAVDPSKGTFNALAEEWFERQVVPVRTDGHARTIRSRLDRLILPSLGDKDPGDITAPELLALLRRIEDQGHIETAHRVSQIVGQVLRYGIATGQAPHDITADLRGALIPRQPEHFPTLTDPDKIGELMRAIHSFSGSIIVRCAMLFQIYTAVRPGEMRKGEWKEIEGDLWKIPAERMKKRRNHLVPLSKQSMAVLDELRPFTGDSQFIFPSIRSKTRPISDATVNAALRRMGYAQSELTGHGFRAMFSTIANEHQWPSDVIELQLAHVDKNSVRAAYNHAELLDKRRELLQWWGDWLDEQEKEKR